MALASLTALISVKGVREAVHEIGSLRGELRTLVSAFGSAGGAIRAVEDNLRKLLQTSALVSAASAGVGAISSRIAADTESLTRGIATFSRDADDLQSQLTRLRDVAKLPGLSFEGAVRGSISLQAAGLSANLAERSMMAFGNALATVGKGSADLDGVTLALTQIASAGKLMGDELNQLSERTPQVRQALLRAFGTASTEEIRKMGLTAQQVIVGIVSELEKLPRVSGGIANVFENIKDLAERAIEPLGKGINEALSALVPMGESLLGYLKQAATLAGEIVSATGRSGVVEAVGNSLAATLQKAFGNVDFGQLMVNGIAGIFSLIEGLPRMFQEMWTWGAQTFGVIMANAREVGRWLLESSQTFRDALTEVGRFLGHAVDSLGKLLADMFNNLSPLLKGLGAKAIEFTPMGMIASGILSDRNKVTPMVFQPLPAWNVSSPFGNMEAYARAINSSRRPLAGLPDGLIFGGPASLLGEGTDSGNIFAEWDKHLAKIEANTRQTAQALLSSRVVGGGPLSRAGLSAGERLSAPDSIVRPVSSQLEKAVLQLTRKTGRQSRSDAALYGVR